MMEQVRLFTVCPMEKWLGSLMNHVQGWTTVRDFYSHALELGSLSEREDYFRAFGLLPACNSKKEPSLCLPASGISPPLLCAQLFVLLFAIVLLLPISPDESLSGMGKKCLLVKCTCLLEHFCITKDITLGS